MSIAKHNGVYSVGDIIGYSGSYATKFCGYKLVKKVWVDQIAEWVYIGQYGHVEVNKFAAVGADFSTLTNVEIDHAFAEIWTPGTEYKKGDILVGKEGEQRMLFAFFSDEHVERLTPRKDVGMYGFGYSTLDDYSRNFGPLTVHTVQGYYGNLNGKKFSEV